MSAMGAALFFAPNYMIGLVESWEVALFIVGIILLVIEIFIIPGFGIAGAGGLLLVITSLLTSLIGNVGLDFPSFAQITSAIWTMAITLVLFIVLLFSLGRYLPKSSRFGRMVLVPELGSISGYTSADTHDELMGQTGQALTVLRPSGVAVIGGQRVDVVSQGDFIPQGTAVQVVQVQGSRVEVRTLNTIQEPISSV
jgi:membrane-bound serine protease (ClpP class)